ncbi:hypothetical protein D3C74_392330 [compost metagenome]
MVRKLQLHIADIILVDGSDEQLSKHCGPAGEAGYLIETYPEHIFLVQSRHACRILVEPYNPLIGMHRPYDHPAMLNYIPEKRLFRMDGPPKMPDVDSKSSDHCN